MTVALARDVEDFLQAQVRSGVCADASELVNDVIRSLRELDDLIAKAPFNTLERNATLKLCVTFLADKPRVRPKLPLRSSKEAVDAIAMTDRDVFIVSRRKANGFYGFPNAFIEKELGVLATSRNWSTVTQVAEFARSRPVRSPRRSERVP